MLSVDLGLMAVRLVCAALVFGLLVQVLLSARAHLSLADHVFHKLLVALGALASLAVLAMASGWLEYALAMLVLALEGHVMLVLIERRLRAMNVFMRNGDQRIRTSLALLFIGAALLALIVWAMFGQRQMLAVAFCIWALLILVVA